MLVLTISSGLKSCALLGRWQVGLIAIRPRPLGRNEKFPRFTETRALVCALLFLSCLCYNYQPK